MDSPEYLAWEANAPAYLKRDILWKLPAYRYGSCVADLAWIDVAIVSRQPTGKALADQLFRAVSSIPANIAEGYSKRSGADRARYYGYALGSAREAREHYLRARGPLGKRMESRVLLLSRVIAMLVAAIPAEKRRNR